MQTFNGEYLHRTIYHMAAALCRSLAENQPFTDGNKRIAWGAARTFLRMNQVRVPVSDEVAAELMLKISLKEINLDGIADFFRRHDATAEETQ